MFQVSIRYRVRPGVNLSQVQCPSTYLRVHQQFLDLKKLFNWLHKEHEKLWRISAKLLDVLCVIVKETYSLALIDTKRLRGKILSVLWQWILKGTALMNRCKFDSSNKKQMLDFLKDWTNCCLDFLRLQIKLLKINCKNLVTEVIRSMDARWAIIRFIVRTGSSSTTRGRRYTTTKSIICWFSTAHDRIGSGLTAVSRDVWRTSICSIGCWTEIHRLRRRGEEHPQEVRCHKKWQSKIWVSLSGTSESDLSVRELRSEILHLSFRRKLQFDSRCLCGWQYWIINIVSKPCYGTSKKASTTSWKVNPMPRAATMVATPTTPPASISKNSSGSTQILLHRQLAYQLEVQKLQSHLLIMEDPEREKQSQFFLTDGFTHSSKCSQSRCTMDWWSWRCAKSIDDLITSASTLGALVSDENSWFQDCTWTQEDRDKKEASRNKSPQEKAKLNQRRDHLRAVRLVGWSTVATKKPAIYWKSQ